MREELLIALLGRKGLLPWVVKQLRGLPTEERREVYDKVQKIKKLLLESSQEDVTSDLCTCTCTVPPEGWFCTRKNGHSGPCAAVPDPAYSATEGNDPAPLPKPEERDCPHLHDCSFLKNGLDWCNLLPVWWQSVDGKAVAPTKDCLIEKMEKRGVTCAMERCSRVFPTRPCKYTVQHEREDNDIR